MCGIFGFVSCRPQDPALVLDGLRFLEYRGYDSWGVAASAGGAIDVEKSTGQIGGAHVDLAPTPASLGHTRWATHGGVTYANAHPHVDCGGRLALIHNGIVENHHALRAELSSHHTFTSQTDTEVLVHLIEEALADGENLTSAVRTVFSRVQGLSAIAVLDAASDEIVVAKNGSPLVLGSDDEGTYLASDAHALLERTHRLAFLEDGQMATLTRDGVSVFDLASGQTEGIAYREVSWDAQQSGLGDYAHFMDKEIHEQPAVLRRIAAAKGEAARRLAELVSQASDVYLIGCGTAYHAALSGRYMLSEMAGIRSTAVVASEMSLNFPHLGPGSLVIALSQSGETVDVLEAVKEARARGATIVGLVNAEGSALDRFADFAVLLDCGPERCVLATKSYSAKLAVLALTAQTAAGRATEGREALERAASSLHAMLESRALARRLDDIARTVGDQEHLFVLGRHRNYPLALEAALKIKEVSYMHAEGFASGELKHGVIALVTPGTPCVMLAPDGDFRKEILAAAAEVKARGAFTIGLSPSPADEFDTTVEITGGESSAFEIACATQMLAYRLALLRGCDPDRPRNLAKSVTVK